MATAVGRTTSSALQCPSCRPLHESQITSLGRSSTFYGQRVFQSQQWRPLTKQCQETIRAGTSTWGTPPLVTQADRERAAAEAAERAAELLKDVETVERLHTRGELKAFLQRPERQLAVVQYGTSLSAPVQQLYPALVALSRMCNDVAFALVLGDESDETRAMMAEAGVKRLPHFVFYKGGKKIHEEEGMTEEQLQGNVYYHGHAVQRVVDLRSQEELDQLMATAGDKLVVLDIGLTRCGPCVKVYPTVVRLAERMGEICVFGRVKADENGWTTALLENEDIVEVPTFLFLKNGESKGRYVGSSPGSLIGEILKRQGVPVS